MNIYKNVAVISGLDPHRSILQDKLLRFFSDKNEKSLIVEGGAHVLQQFIDDGLWDEARIFVGTPQFSVGLKAPQLSGTLLTTQEIEGDYLFVLKRD